MCSIIVLCRWIINRTHTNFYLIQRKNKGYSFTSALKYVQYSSIVYIHYILQTFIIIYWFILGGLFHIEKYQ